MPGSAQWIDVPHVSQLMRIPGFGWDVSLFACGPACAAMVAAYVSGRAPAFDRAVLELGGRAIAGRGTQPWQVAQAIRSLAPGARADTAAVASAAAARSLVAYALSQGVPLIALVRPSWVATRINHYVVVTGIDPARGRVAINDPLTAPALELPAPVFLAAWQRVRGIRPFTYVWAR